MDDPEASEMTDDERDAFLGRAGTGVIALETDSGEPPHAVPVSYGYDPLEETFYFRLAAGPDREKGELEDRTVTFVSYGQGDDGWRSVVAEGRLESTTDEDVATETLDGLSRVSIPLVDVFGQPPAEVSFGFYRLAARTLTTRRESETRA